MTRLLRFGVAVAALVVMTVPAPASAMTYDKLAYLTFSAPVQIPGATLSAGTYRFHITNPDTSRTVMQVLSDNGAVVYSQFLTREDWRSVTANDATVTFLETPAGVPPAVRSFFYGGENRGYEFVWAKGEPNMILPPLGAQPPITYTPLAVAPVAEAPVAAVAAPLVDAPIVAEPVPEAVVAEAAPVAEQAPAELPRTASPVPLAGIGGFLSLMTGLGIGWLRRRVG